MAKPAPAPRPPRQIMSIDGETVYTRDVAEIQPIIEGFLYPGLTLFCGRPKGGKSWLMLQTALAVASGSTLAGRLRVCQPGQVLYLALEETEDRTTRRMRKLQPQPGDFLRDISFAYRGEIEPAFSGGIMQVDGHLRTHPATRLVVIDTLLAFQRVERGKSADLLLSDYNQIQPLQEIASHHNAAVVLVDHSRKMAGTAIDVVSGSTGKSAAPDCISTLKRQTDGSSLVEVIPRDANEQTYQLTLITDTPFGWKVIAQGQEATMSVERREALELLREEPMTAKELARQTGRKEGAVRMLLKRMAEDGIVMRREDKNGDKWHAL